MKSSKPADNDKTDSKHKKAGKAIISDTAEKTNRSISKKVTKTAAILGKRLRLVDDDDDKDLDTVLK